MSKISDEIRKCADIYDDKAFLPKLNSRYHALADRIDAEMVELPKDMDGVPIHVGDTVYTTDGSKAYVERICIMANTTHVKCAFSDGRIIEFQPTELTHTRPDSLERIADEIEKADVDGCTDWADRIRKFAKEREHE